MKKMKLWICRKCRKPCIVIPITEIAVDDTPCLVEDGREAEFTEEEYDDFPISLIWSKAAEGDMYDN